MVEEDLKARHRPRSRECGHAVSIVKCYEVKRHSAMIAPMLFVTISQDADEIAAKAEHTRSILEEPDTLAP